MKLSLPLKPQEKTPQLLAFYVSIPFLTLAVWNIWLPYSLWVDELFSVVASSGTWSFVIETLLVDVHPPLYQSLLKLWITLCGDGEITLRLLSAIFSFAAVAILVYTLRDRATVFLVAVTAFFTSSFVFLHYTQEARGYSLLLALATLATTHDLHSISRKKHVNKALRYTTIFALSLTHYFGLAFACLLLFRDISRQRSLREIVERCGLYLLMLIWPVLHLTFGEIGSQMGGNHWITSDGIGTTIRMFAEGVFSAPVALQDRLKESNQIAWLLFVVFNSFIFVFLSSTYIQKASGESRQELRSLLFIAVVFIFIISLIDMYTPVSWPRYYIVLLPVVSLCFGYLIQLSWDNYSSTWQRAFLTTGVVIYVTYSAIYTYNFMQVRWGTDNSWKGLAKVVNSSDICQPHCWFFNDSSKLNLYSYYFLPSMGEKPESTILGLEGLLSLPNDKKRPIVAAHIKSSDVNQLRKHYDDWLCLEPNNPSPTNVILMSPVNPDPKILKLCL